MLRLFNSLTRTVEDFKPLHDKEVRMYTCGPTVYSFAHIGNFRTYTTADILVRTLQLNGYHVKYVMNLTDVGHLTGDNLGDADLGEDRMEKSAKKEGKTAWEVAEFYTEVFLQDFKKLNLETPLTFAKATDHIKEQIDLVKELEDKGFTYETSDGIYFDTSMFPHYGELSDLDEIKEGARVEVNEEKRNARDFALWKFSYPHGKTLEEYKKEIASSSSTPRNDEVEKRQMEWESPWGKGFPGWHIECSAMSIKYLGEQLDIHTGGIDLKSTHHPNEIAQSEAVTGKQFSKYWVHSAFMLVNGEKMSKSKGNVYRVYDMEKEGFEPLALRYLYLQTHYRQEMNFTFSGLEAAHNALHHLRQDLKKLHEPKGKNKDFLQKFADAVNNDLNMAEALSVVWEMLKSDIPSGEKSGTLFVMDQVLGLDLEKFYHEETTKTPVEIPEEVRALVVERENLRKQRMFGQADQVRNKIKKLGFDIEDIGKKTEIRKI